MTTKLNENISNHNHNYLYPFLWIHGESNEVLLEYLDQMSEQGIHSFCIESRFYKEFMQPRWWEILDLLLSEAKKRDMKVWILDDSNFPTGSANHKVTEAYKKRYLYCRRFDLAKVTPNSELDVTNIAGFRACMTDRRHDKDTIISAYLVKNDPSTMNDFSNENVIDITHCIQSNRIYFDANLTTCSVFVLYSSICGKEDFTKDHLDPMRKEATDILINEVYEPHYQRYKHYFGSVIRGFFSDEPRFGNIKGSNASIGRCEMPLPWNDLVKEECVKKGIFNQLYLLFYGNTVEKQEIQYQYMNIISKLYSENFSQHLGNYCVDRNIEYVGHVIEDNGAHCRLGYGPGHYFRAMKGQTIAGIDVIGGQIVPGMDYPHTAFNEGGSNGEFYHYALCKLGASCAKLDKNKRGRLMCEAFGAYGWVEGLKMMKWITNHLISHGVNYIVPHAFNPKEFPDFDCPPHFYAHGNNPQFPYFHKWANYTNRLCHMLNDGYQVCKVGVMYHAFAEWSGAYMPIEKVLKELQCHQIDCNVISEDYIMELDLINNQEFKINGFSYEVLIIPYAEYLPQELLKKINLLSNYTTVLFIHGYPNNMISSEAALVELNTLSSYLKTMQIQEVMLDQEEKHLVYYHYHREDEDVFIFSNEAVFDEIDTTVALEYDLDLQIYDAYKNKTYALAYDRKGNHINFHLHLQPYEMLVLVTGKGDKEKEELTQLACRLKGNLKISTKSYHEQDFQVIQECGELLNLTRMLPDFCGTMKYEFDYIAESIEQVMILSEVYETVTVFVNGKCCDTLISGPYEFDLEYALQVGNNHIEIMIVNTLQRNQRDGGSEFYIMDPIGILEPIEIWNKASKKG